MQMVVTMSSDEYEESEQFKRDLENEIRKYERFLRQLIDREEGMRDYFHKQYEMGKMDGDKMEKFVGFANRKISEIRNVLRKS